MKNNQNNQLKYSSLDELLAQFKVSKPSFANEVSEVLGNLKNVVLMLIAAAVSNLSLLFFSLNF